MLSFAYVLECEGYGKLMRDVLSEPNEPRRPISGTTAILCDLDACEEASVDDEVEVRTRSEDGRRGSGGFSESSSLEADERVLRERLLLWRSRSRSLSLVRGRLRSRSGSFLRRRCESDEFNMIARRRGAPRQCDCEPASWTGFCGRDHQRGYGFLQLGVAGGHFARSRLSGQQLAIHRLDLEQGAVRGLQFPMRCCGSFGE